MADEAFERIFRSQEASVILLLTISFDVKFFDHGMMLQLLPFIYNVIRLLVMSMNDAAIITCYHHKLGLQMELQFSQPFQYVILCR